MYTIESYVLHYIDNLQFMINGRFQGRWTEPGSRQHIEVLVRLGLLHRRQAQAFPQAGRVSKFGVGVIGGSLQWSTGE